MIVAIFTDDKNLKHNAESSIIHLSNKIEDLADMMELDELIKEYLEAEET